MPDAPAPIPLTTPLGELHGRAIELEGCVLETCPRQLRVRCRIWREGATVPCEVLFTGLLALRVDEFDFNDYLGGSCLAEVPDSPWLASCRARDHGHKVLAEHRHLVLRTYDDVIEALCTGHELTLGEPIPDPPEAPEDEPDEP